MLLNYFPEVLIIYTGSYDSALVTPPPPVLNVLIIFHIASLTAENTYLLVFLICMYLSIERLKFFVCVYELLILFLR